MSQATIYLEAYALLLAMMVLLWLVSVWRRNASIVDPFWGTTFVIAGWWYFVRTPEGDPGRKLLLMALVSVWGLRLSIYLLWRNWGEPEDPRYQAFRRRYGPERYWWVSFFQVFLLQGTLSWVIGAPLHPAPQLLRRLGVLVGLRAVLGRRRRVRRSARRLEGVRGWADAKRRDRRPRTSRRAARDVPCDMPTSPVSRLAKRRELRAALIGTEVARGVRLMSISIVPDIHRSLVFAAVGGLAVWLAADTAHASTPCSVTEADDDINLAGSLRYCIDQVNQGATDHVVIQDFHWYAPNTPLVIERSARISGYGRIVMPGEEFVGDSLFVVGTPCPGPACGEFASVEIEGLEIAAVGVTDVRGIDLHAGHALRLEDVQLYEFAISGSSGGCVRAGQQSSLEIVGSTLEGCMAADGGAVFSEATDTTIATSSFAGNDAVWTGGAVAIGTANFFARSLTVEGSSFSNNAAHWGGAIKASGSPIAVEVIDTHIVGNTATVRGGGVYGKGSFEGCVIESNQAGVWGGGLNLVESGTVRDSTLWGNLAREGGGVAFQPAGNFELRLEHSTVAYNAIGGDGARGAGLAVTGGDTRVLNSTFTDNVAKDDVADSLGGGVAVLGGKFAAEHATFAYNTATLGGGIYASSGALWVELRSSMVVHSSGNDCEILSGFSTVTSLDTDGSCSVDVTDDPKLDAFGDHGGPTWTWWPTSPSVLDAADCIYGVDQRYEPRPDEQCDIGALEQ